MQHRELASGRWATMTLATQMANIGSEVERALNWRAKNKEDYAVRAFERALELIDLTLDSLRGYSRLKEVSRMREVLVDYFLAGNTFGSTEGSWKKYFLGFNVAARRNAN